MAVQAAGAVLSAASVVAYGLLVGGLTESRIFLSPTAKTTILTAIAATAAILLLYRSASAYLRKPGPIESARLVERAFPGYGDRLVTAVQLGGLSEDELRGQSVSIVSALVERTVKELDVCDLKAAVSARPLIKSFRVLASGMALLFAIPLVAPDSAGSGMARLWSFRDIFTNPGSAVIYAFRGDASLIRGEDFTVSGFIAGTDGGLEILYRWDGDDAWNVRPVSTGSTTGEFTVTIENPSRSFRYYLETEGAETPRYLVSVIERPVVTSLELSLTYPAYTGEGTVAASNGDGNVRALAGTKVDARVTVNKPLSAMTVHWSDSTMTPCEVGGIHGSFSFTVETSRDYWIGLADTLGITNDNPIVYRVTALSDESPSVSLLSPAVDAALPLSMKIPVMYRARDDFGLTEVVLHRIYIDTVGEKTTKLLSGPAGTLVEDAYMLDLSVDNLLPGDEMRIFMRVLDNDTVNGPKAAVSDTITLRVPSMTDIMTEADKTQESSIDRLQSLSDTTGRDKSSLDDISRGIKQGDEIDWSDRNAIDSAKKNTEQFRDDIRDVNRSIEQMAERLSSEDMAALETLDKYREVSQLLESLADSELSEALKQLTMAQVSVDPKQLKEAIDAYKITAEEISKKLDRTIAFLKQVKALQRFESTRRMLEDLAYRQIEAEARYEVVPGDSSVWREQERLASEMAALEKELAETAAELKEAFNTDTSELERRLDEEPIAQTMDEAARNMSSGRQSEAKRNMSDAKSRLAGLLDNLDRMDTAMRSRNSAEIQARLFRALSDLLAVSGMQETVIGENAADQPADENAYQAAARRQLEVVDSLDKSKKAVDAFGEMIVQFAAVFENLHSDIRGSMTGAVTKLSAGTLPEARILMRTSLAATNRFIHIMTMFLENGEGGAQGMPGDMMQQMQMIANGQLSLQMRMGAGGEEMMMKLAAEQQRLAEMLQSLGEKISSDQRLREMVEQLAREMDETADDIRRNESRRVIERRQQDIYRRLLDARRSRREKDEQEDRKSFTAKQNVSEGADELTADRGEKMRGLTDRLREATGDDFTPEYQRLIRWYFESMLKDAGSSENGFVPEGTR